MDETLIELLETTTGEVRKHLQENPTATSVYIKFDKHQASWRIYDKGDILMSKRTLHD